MDGKDETVAAGLHYEKTWESVSNSFYVVQDDPEEDDDSLAKHAAEGNFLKECMLAQRCLDVGDMEEALAHYTTAARRGSASALFNRALMLEMKLGTNQPPPINEILPLYRRAAVRGVSHAKHRLGYHLALTGDDGCGGIAEGTAFILAAAEDGLHTAMYDYGMMCMYAVSIDKDEELAVKWLKRALDGNISAAAFELAVYYSRPGDADESDGNASERMKMAAGLAHHAAGDGHSLAQDLLGQFYSKGNGVDVDFDTAYACFTAAAKDGVLSSMRDRAMLLEVGKGCDPDPEQAVQIYRECSKVGDAMSKFRLGMCYYYGIGGLTRKYKIAAKHIREAASTGLIPAKVFMLMRELTVGDEDTQLKAEIAVIAANATHPNRNDALSALVSLGLVEACKACGVTKHEVPTALLTCTGCNNVKYCSKACQESNWAKHRGDCDKTVETGGSENNAKE